MTAAIPNELMIIAANIVFEPGRYDGSGYFSKDGMIDDIALALQAERSRATEIERERCALIVDRWAWDDRRAAAMAANIRHPSHPTGE